MRTWMGVLLMVNVCKCDHFFGIHTDPSWLITLIFFVRSPFFCLKNTIEMNDGRFPLALMINNDRGDPLRPFSRNVEMMIQVVNSRVDTAWSFIDSLASGKLAVIATSKMTIRIWLVVTGCHFLFSQKYWVSNHPNWRTHIFSEGWRTTTNQK